MICSSCPQDDDVAVPYRYGSCPQDDSIDTEDYSMDMEDDLNRAVSI